MLRSTRRLAPAAAALLAASLQTSPTSAGWRPDARPAEPGRASDAAPSAGPEGGAAPARDRASRRLHELFEEYWEWTMEDSPTWASSLGDPRWDDRWQDISLAAHERRDAHDREMLARVRRIDPDALTPEDRLSRDLFERRLEQQLRERSFRTWLVPLNQRAGVQTAHELAERLRLRTVEQHEDWLSRMRRLPERVDQTIALMREGMRTGVVAPRVIMERVPDQVAMQVVSDPERSPFWKTFAELPASLEPEERDALRRRARRVITEAVVPAYRRFARFLEEEYLPATRLSVGASELPDGEAFYAFRVRRYTTTDLTPEQVHRLGLSEIARIRQQMEAVIEETGFEGTFEEFLRFLRTDPRFHSNDPDELLRRYRAFSKRADPELAALFGRLPRMPYGVRPIPEESAPDTTTAYYTGPAADGSRAGYYWVNLYKPETRYFWEIPALSLHEAVPGHHLQIALAQELGELPSFRKHQGYTAFVEGWALYAESLGEEMGLYEDPHDRFGQLTYEMWRAVRLVVDTGLHAMGWSRERAIELFAANAPRSRHDIVNEIDRYIAWPGQALAYKIGELKIRELRERATNELGPHFDVRDFHDVVLGSGAVPLDVLEAQVDAWIVETLAGSRPEGTLKAP